MSAEQFLTQGWCKLDYDPALAAWIERALPHARATLSDRRFAQWHRYQGTWFAGINALDNDATGAVGDSGKLRGKTVDFIRQQIWPEDFAWDSGQISVCYPGYPQAMAGESLAAFRFRKQRDAAHVDGLLPEGPHRRRHLREHHAFILGIPMVNFSAGASPFTVWEGSHELIRTALKKRFENLPVSQWGDEDISDTYKAARNHVFEVCKRVPVYARPGEAYIAHRLIVHGMAPWHDTANAGSDGRMICYFRPETHDPFAWLNNP